MDNNKKIYGFEIIYIILANIFLFQTPLQKIFTPIKYFDELASILIFTTLLLYIAINKKITLLIKEEIKILITLIVLIIIGIINNFVFGIQTGWNAILLDIGNFIKFYIIYLGSLNIVRLLRKDIVIKILAKSIKVYTIITFAFSILNLVSDIGMSYDIRYGMRSFEFIHNHPGTLSVICICYIFILNIYRDYFKAKSIKVYLALNLFILITTFRSKSIALVVVYLILSYMIINDKNINLGKISIICSTLILVSYNQIIHYFSSGLTPRSALLKGGLDTAIKYFPLGTGFSTYGSYGASKYYSSLYYDYGFHNMYGLSPDLMLFGSDSFWPMIIAQFGFIGLGMYIYILYNLIKVIHKRSKEFKYTKIGSYFILIYLLVSTITDSAIVHYTSTCIFFLLPLAWKSKYEKADSIISVNSKIF